jgi:hypothetical protein
VKLLLENGARPDFEDVRGRTLLSRAGSTIIAELLQSYCRCPAITDRKHVQTLFTSLAEAARDEGRREKRDATHPSSKSTYDGTDNDRIT